MALYRTNDTTPAQTGIKPYFRIVGLAMDEPAR